MQEKQAGINVTEDSEISNRYQGDINGSFKLLLDSQLNIKALDPAASHLLGQIDKSSLVDILCPPKTDENWKESLVSSLSTGHSVKRAYRISSVWGIQQVTLIFIPRIQQRRLLEILVMGYGHAEQRFPLWLTRKVKVPLSQRLDQRRRGLLDRMEDALYRGEFYLDYQPQICLGTGEITGVEALLRWKDRAGVIMQPGEFLAAAEQSGMIHPIGEWSIRMACKDFKSWLGSGIAPSRLSVNLSMNQLLGEGVVDMIDQILRETGLEASFFHLEIKDSIAIYSQRAIHIIESLKRLGIGISIDGFGVGYCSLEYLNNLPLDMIKMNHSYMSEFDSNPKSKTAIKAMVAMAQSLGLAVVAQGVETQEQRDFLLQISCNEAQGYLFGRPVSTQELEHYYLK